MLPTSARVAQEVYEPLIGIQYPMLCSRLGDTWQIGASSIREDQLIASGLRFVHWCHASDNVDARKDPQNSPTVRVYQRLEDELLRQRSNRRLRRQSSHLFSRQLHRRPQSRGRFRSRRHHRFLVRTPTKPKAKSRPLTEEQKAVAEENLAQKAQDLLRKAERGTATLKREKESSASGSGAKKVPKYLQHLTDDQRAHLFRTELSSEREAEAIEWEKELARQEKEEEDRRKAQALY